jgi:hypothetical protein
MSDSIDKTHLGGEVILKHIRGDKILLHRAIRDNKRNKDGYTPLDGDPKFSKKDKEVK